MAEKQRAMSLAIVILAFILWTLTTGTGQEYEELDPNSPEARATEHSIRRAEHRAMQMAPDARETARAERRVEMRENEQAVELRNPLPLPVEVRNPAAVIAAGRPAGAACPSDQICALNAAPTLRETLIVTSVWSATRLTCDDVAIRVPAVSAVLFPWWRCQKSFSVEGPGAGYTGFIVVS